MSNSKAAAAIPQNMDIKAKNWTKIKWKSVAEAFKK
tara:strand:+ start:637 stop:744 length:108 start_codon:yes stop_codon:yes gene_type:complete